MTETGAPSKHRKSVLNALAGLALIATIAFAFFSMPSPLPQSSVDAAGRYRLVDSTGALFDRASLKGHPYLTYFGYTHCPDMCPAMLGQLTKARAKLGKDAEGLRIVFITIDPERDTPERLSSFIAQTSGPVIALTGSSETIDKVADSAAVFVKRIPQSDGSYTIEHTTSVFIYDRDGDFFDTIIPADGSAVIMEKMRGVLGMPAGSATAAPALGQAGR